MSELSERLSQEPRPTAQVGPRPEAEYYQRHPIKGQLSLFIAPCATWPHGYYPKP